MKAKKFNKTFDRWILPIFIFMVTLFSTASIYNLTLDLNDLIRVEGEVRNIRIEEDRDSRGRSNFNFYVYLTQGTRFKIMDDTLFEPYRNTIQQNIQPGDTVIIYKRTQIQTNLGMGTSNLIYQLEHDGQIIMPLNVMHRNFKGLLIFELFVLAGLSTVQVIRMRKKATHNN
ncbi:MAG: hypothetical protein WBA74_12330 [Cyclobacteriaceae bacterium]